MTMLRRRGLSNANADWTATRAQSDASAQQRARLVVARDQVLLGEVVARAAGVIHGAVLAGVEVGVVVGGKGGKDAVDDRGDEEIERLAQLRFFLGQLERESRGVGVAGDERLDRAADVRRIRVEELRHGHRIQRELQPHAAIDFLAEVFVARGLAAFVVDDAVAVRAGVDAVDGAVDAAGRRRQLTLHHKRLGMIRHLAVPRFSEAILEVLRTEAGRPRDRPDRARRTRAGCVSWRCARSRAWSD